MDILPEPNNAAPILTRIPYLPHYSWEPWGTEGFLTIPRKHGFLDQAGKFKAQHDNSNMASMLQVWLFFGLLAGKIGRAFEAQDFVKQDELGQDFITLAPLKKRKVFYGEINEGDEMEIQLKIIDFRPSSLAHLPHVCEVWHSIMWLYEVLGIGSFKDALQTCSLQTSIEGSAFCDFDKPLDSFRRRLFDRLDRTQWCPFNRRRLQSLQHCTLRYVTSIPRNSFPPFLTHRNCSENACTGNAIDVETFQTRHVDENCSCSFMGVSPDDLANICRQGSIPLIEIKPSGSQSQELANGIELHEFSHGIDISLRSWKPSSRFTAISHVWSHGLGNQQSNSLPICQLKKLALAVDRASHSQERAQLIWMDILCIPVTPEYAAERRTSINKMGIIYTAAETVLVLDYELQRIPIKDLDKPQVLAHLLTCSWMERAWTYNEGSLARSCCFQFADEIFDSERIHDIRFGPEPTKDRSQSLRYLLELDLSNHCIAEFGRSIDEFRPSSSVRLPSHFRGSCTFIRGWNALGRRSTSQPEDLLEILANLRGINLSQLSHFKPEERIAVLISFQRFIPFSLLTSPNQSKYSVSHILCSIVHEDKCHFHLHLKNIIKLCLSCSKCLSEPDRWIPRTIDGSYLPDYCLMDQRPLGDGLELYYAHSKGKRTYLSLMILPLGLELSGDRDVQICASGSKSGLRVKFLRESYPPLDRTSTMNFLVVETGDLLWNEPNLPLKGCCLQLSDTIHLSRDKLEQSGKLCTSLRKFLSINHKELRFTYDCPIRVEAQTNLLRLAYPKKRLESTLCQPDEAHLVAHPWTITIKSSMCLRLYTNSWNGILVA